MSETLDDWIANYQTAQKQKHAKFLKELKHEFTERTAQQRRDRLNQINPQQVQRLLLQTSRGRHRPAAADKRTKAQF